ncbi:hypothetical protein SCHPADRAFT_897044 [Schizopora paradoxa]|uniref:Uncharacterized protein n=1 Tax=Schizopora paradoxa TaxID=27342 RepID=A0A0H2R4Q9_9AGAM|nr:hypothetical protein SCHPADRAFT_897044 [Schizopora paradoxa]
MASSQFPQLAYEWSLASLYIVFSKDSRRGKTFKFAADVEIQLPLCHSLGMPLRALRGESRQSTRHLARSAIGVGVSHARAIPQLTRFRLRQHGAHRRPEIGERERARRRSTCPAIAHSSRFTVYIAHARRCAVLASQAERRLDARAVRDAVNGASSNAFRH